MEPRRLGKFEIVEKIGEGGMGEVYRAHDPVLGRDVAVKTMTAGAGDDEHRRRFLREAQSAARLNHPNITTVHDFGEEQGRMYIAMELLEGRDLKELIASREPLGLDEKLALMDQVCDGLAFAHARDVVHRDLKPANIHILPSGQVKIMDFGLARMSSSQMTRAGMILGTPYYMSPEQVRGEKATARSDVFALGALFYELLSGRKPFDAPSMQGVLFQVMKEEPTSLETLAPDAPATVCAVVRKALAKDPAQRYADAGQLRDALRTAGIRAGERLGSRPPPVSSPLPRRSREAAWALEETRAAPAVGPTAAATVPAPSTAPTIPIPSAKTVRAEAPTVVAAATVPVPSTSSTVLLPAAETVRADAPAPPEVRREGPPAAASRRISIAAVALAVLVVVIPTGWWALRRRAPAPSPEGPPASPVDVAVKTSLDAARRSLEDKAYRRAAEQAEEILRADPQNASARELAQQARSALREVEEAVARVRVGLESGDTDGAANALSRLIALDPRNSDAAVFARQLNQVFKGRAQEALRSMQRSRRDAELARAGGTEQFARALSLASGGELALRGDEYASATRQLIEARDAFENSRRGAQEHLAVVSPPPAPPTPAPATPAPPTPAPATLAPATLAPATQPPAVLSPTQSEAAARQAIRGVLDEYRAAFERRDADSLRAVQPGVDYEGMRQVFATVTGYTVRIDVKEVAVKGDTATAGCIVTYNPVPKPAGKIQPVSTVFHLKKAGELWLIDRLERK